MTDLRVLIDQLEQIVREARPVPLTPQVRLDKQPLYDLVEQMRAEVARTSTGQTPAGVDQQALADAVSAAIRENIPEIARAVATASAREPRNPDAPPPGAPF